MKEEKIKVRRQIRRKQRHEAEEEKRREKNEGNKERGVSKLRREEEET